MLLPEHFTKPDDLGLPRPDVIVLQLEIPIPTVMQILRTAKAAGIDVLLNPAPAVELEDEAYQAVTHLSMSLTYSNSIFCFWKESALRKEPD